ncbi:MAG: CBS domain-containing protein [Candidatus Zixiibacteriota bacterium]|nr:MAG: CBS domain-containing protein [candidate division Zixibacteria bacterium]
MLIVFEMTSDYRIILPLMVTVVLSTLVASKLCPHSIYTIKLFHRGIDLKEGKDVNILRSHKVAEVMDRNFETLDASTTLHDIFRTIQRSRDTYFIVKNSGGRMLGVLSFQDIRNIMTEHTLDYLVIAADLVVPETVCLKADDDLRQAYKFFSQRDNVLLPVVADDNSEQVIGVVRREQLIDYYHKLLIETLRS